jgi:hypothetical protein
MKRESTWIFSDRSGDIRKDISEKQLAAIGAISIAYNELERIVDYLLCYGLLGEYNAALAARINGLDGKVELIRLAAEDLELDKLMLDAISDSLGQNGFTGLKSLRDALIHARPLHGQYGIAQTKGKRGATSDLLITQPALDQLYERIVILTKEFRPVIEVFFKSHQMKRESGQAKERLEQEIQGAFALFLGHRSHRLSLPLLPEFPDPPPDPPWLRRRRPPPPKSKS